MPDRLMQQHAAPTGPQHHGHFSRRCRLGFQIHQGLPERFIRLTLPIIFLQIVRIEHPAPCARGTAFQLAVRLHNHRNIQPDKRANIAHHLAIRTQNRDMLYLAAQ